MNKRYIVDLTADERAGLLALLRKGTAPARRLTRARILLLADEGSTRPRRSDQEIAATLHVHRATVERTRRRFVEGGVERALAERPRPGGRPKLDGRQEAYLVALACSAPPEGRARWTMQLLADRLVALEMVDTISDETVRRALQKTRSSPGSGSSGASRRWAPISSGAWRTCSTSTPRRATHGARWSASTSSPTS